MAEGDKREYQFKDLVHVRDQLFIELGGIEIEKLEAAFYFCCYYLGQHQLASDTIKAIDDPLEGQELVIRAWDIAYCRLGQRVGKKVTTKKAKRIFSKHPNVEGDFIETPVDRLWVSVDNKHLKSVENAKAVVTLPFIDSHALIPRVELPESRKLAIKDLHDLRDSILSAKGL